MTNSLPPLPLIDGHLFIDNSAMEYLNSCHRAAEYSFIRQRKLAEDRSALSFGKAIHLAVEERYKQVGSRKVTEETRTAQRLILTEHFQKEPAHFDDHRTEEFANRVIDEYNEEYPTENFKVLPEFIEKSFAVEVGKIGEITIIYTGRIDLIVEEQGHLINVDHKTTSIMGSLFFEEQSISPQHQGYCWAIAETLKFRPPEFLINAICVRKPTEKGKGKEIEFARQRFPIFQSTLDEWQQNCLALIEEFIWNYAKGYLPMKRKWCIAKYGRCQYFDVCALPQDQRLLLLKSGMFSKNEWSPLEGRKSEPV